MNETDAPQSSGRRKFLGVLVSTGFAGYVGTVLYTTFRYLSPLPESEASSGQVTIPVSELPVGKAKKIGFKGGPVIVVRKSETEVYALSAVCTHLGCLVTWEEDTQRLECPCHAAKFDLQGTVLGGPAPKALPSYSAKIKKASSSKPALIILEA